MVLGGSKKKPTKNKQNKYYVKDEVPSLIWQCLYPKKYLTDYGVHFIEVICYYYIM